MQVGSGPGSPGPGPGQLNFIQTLDQTRTRTEAIFPNEFELEPGPDAFSSGPNPDPSLDSDPVRPSHGFLFGSLLLCFVLIVFVFGFVYPFFLSTVVF